MKRVSAIALATALLLAACGGDGSIFGSTTTGAETTTTGGTATTGTEPTSTTADAATTTVVTTTAPSVPVVNAQIDEFSRDGQPGCAPIDFSISLPVVSGLPPAIGTRINDRIFETISLRQERFYTDAYDGCDPGLSGEPHAFFQLAFQPVTVTSRLLSIRILGSDYYQGAAHPNGFVFTLNFNPATGDLLALDGILVPGGAFPLAVLVEQHIIADLYGGDAAAAAGFVPTITPAMLTHWAVSEVGLEFTFDPYMIGPSAMGMPTVVVPFTELVGIVDAAGPAGPA